MSNKDQQIWNMPHHVRLRVQENFVKNGQCHDWQGAADKGYGRFKSAHKHKTFLAHRAQLIWAQGLPKPGQIARHLCGRRICINPRHLVWGTHKQNAADHAQHRQNGGQVIGFLARIHDRCSRAVQAWNGRDRSAVARR